MDDNTRAVLVRLIEALEKMARPITTAVVGGAALTNLNSIMDIVRMALELMGGS